MRRNEEDWIERTNHVKKGSAPQLKLPCQQDERWLSASRRAPRHALSRSSSRSFAALTSGHSSSPTVNFGATAAVELRSSIKFLARCWSSC